MDIPTPNPTDDDILSPVQSIIFVSLLFGIPSILLVFSCYIRFRRCEVHRRRTVASCIPNFLLPLMATLPPVALALSVWISARSMGDLTVEESRGLLVDGYKACSPVFDHEFEDWGRGRRNADEKEC